jgi:hypothetical protein
MSGPVRVTITQGTGVTATTTVYRITGSGARGPQGETGATGATGPAGPQGAKGDTGEGVPVGGTAGQVLEKIDGVDFNTQWGTPSAGGSSSEPGDLLATRDLTAWGSGNIVEDISALDPTAQYKELKFVFEDVVTTGTNAALLLDGSIDNQSTWVNQFYGARLNLYFNTRTLAAIGVTSGVAIVDNLYGTASDTLNGRLLYQNLDGNQSIDSRLIAGSPTGPGSGGKIAFGQYSGGVNTDLRFRMSGGNFNAGKLYIYGVKR